VAPTLQQIGAIHSRGAHANAQFVSAERRRIDVAEVKNGFIAKVIENDCAHFSSTSQRHYGTCTVWSGTPFRATIENGKNSFEERQREVAG
jgi:hypothetical protein